MSRVYLIRRSSTLKGSRKVSYWTLKWRDKSGRVRWKSVGRVGQVTRAKAVYERDQLIGDLANGKVSRQKPCRMALSEFVAFHEQQFGHGKRATTIQEWQTAGAHAVKALGDKPLEEVTWEDAGEIRSHLARLNRSKATIRKTLATLRGMFARAAKRGMIPDNPFADEELGAPIKRPKRIFSPAEIDAMIEAAPSPMWKAIVQLAATSGLRKSELLHLRWVDFDSGAGTVRVEEHQRARCGASGHEVPILPWQPKTKRSTRTVPIPQHTAALLLRLKVQSNGSPYLFISSDRLAAIGAKAEADCLRPGFDLVNNFNRQFNGIQRAAVAAPIGCFHDLRKTFATRAASSGVPMLELQAHLGHSSIETTADYYTAIEDSAADRLREVFTRVA